jgi:hypothetical protein
MSVCTVDQIPQKRFCCLTSRSACTWIVAFLILYALGSVAFHLTHFDRYQGAVLFAAMGLACFVNLVQNRTFHCAITGPFFVLVSAALALQSYGVWNVSKAVLWPTVLIVVGIAFLLERRFAR